MKRLCFLGMLFLFALSLSGCTANGCDCGGYLSFCSYRKDYLVNETWPCQINRNPYRWIMGENSWFLTGKPTTRTYYKNHYIADNLLRTPTSDFVKINSNGNYQIQLVGGQKHNSITVIGLPSYAAHMLKIAVCDDTLYLRQINPTKKSKLISYPMNGVIVRIGLRNLRELYQLGNGHVYGRQISSNGLDLFSSGNGNIMLAGTINVCRITKMRPGYITILGADTPQLDIITNNGIINVYGNVGIHQIINEGGYIEVIGANSDCLTIYASNLSSTKIVGNFNLQKILANSRSRVYLAGVRSAGTSVTEMDHAEVGLSGITASLHLNLKGSSRFYGKYLCSNEAYVATRDLSHANIYAHQSIFAMADNNSTIYYFSATPAVSTFVAPGSNITQLSY